VGRSGSHSLPCCPGRAARPTAAHRRDWWRRGDRSVWSPERGALACRSSPTAPAGARRAGAAHGERRRAGRSCRRDALSHARVWRAGPAVLCGRLPGLRRLRCCRSCLVRLTRHRLRDRREVDSDRRSHLWFVDLEILGLREVEDRRDDRRREGLDACVMRANIAVVEAPSGGDTVLGLGDRDNPPSARPSVDSACACAATPEDAMREP
jgi:hypothetical protein